MNGTTICVYCPEELPIGQPARDHYVAEHPEKGPHARIVTVTELVMMTPTLTIKPLTGAGAGLALVEKSCGCGANVCYNTAGCPNA